MYTVAESVPHIIGTAMRHVILDTRVVPVRYSAASMLRRANAIHLLLHIRVLGNETRSCGL